MSNNNLLNTKIGVLGAGQLGLMLGQEASNLCLDIHFLDKSKDFPASAISNNIHEGSFTDYDNVIEFGRDKDVLTIEIENVNTKALKQLENDGIKVYPQPRVIEIIKDKGLQKQFYDEHGLPTSPFQLFDDKVSILKAINNGQLQYPFVQKSRQFGYDGKGVVVIQSAEDNEKIFDTASMIETLVDIDKELAVIIGRNQKGQISTFDTTEMVFNPDGNLLDYLLCPSSVSDEIKQRCQQLATEIISGLDMIGLLAVEFFLDKQGKIIINEVAPRPHNSGHHTIEANAKSQYRILLDILLGFDMKENVSKSFAAIYNILGDIDFTGEPIYEGLDKVLSLDNTFVHLYNKKTTKPLRKMGHITILGDSKDALLSKIDFIKANLKVIA